MSQADLWLDGTLILEQPLHDQVTWRWANWTLSPLGYRPGDTGGTMVPVYAPGLPLLMAAFKFIGGDGALYSVVPLLGALTVWLTYRLGLTLAGPPVAALAAFALLVSPVFLFQLVWPMSDVPATAWWLAAIVTALGGSTLYAVLSGLAAAAAILTRPNLFPLAGLVLGLTLAHHGVNRVGILRATAFAVAALPGPIAVAIINNHLYGSPFASGYGTVETIYAGRHFATNILQYPMWLVETQTPFILLAFAAPLLLRRRGNAATSRLSLFALIFFGGVLLMYLWYTPYPDWTFLRFLLPAFPVLLVAAAASFGVLAPSSPRKRRVAFGVVAIVLAVSGVWQGRDAFRVQAFEARYQAAARFAAALPDNAVFVAGWSTGIGRGQQGVFLPGAIDPALTEDDSPDRNVAGCLGRMSQLGGRKRRLAHPAMPTRTPAQRAEAEGHYQRLCARWGDDLRVASAPEEDSRPVPTVVMACLDSIKQDIHHRAARNVEGF